ncbi:MAG: SDR family NAD(P)-dependent oxidoreductase [Chitinophagales bacterium]|nr:SDR family NAD(P)-dependent oxidoreductase [Chitinophagales bacterium]
MQNFKDKIIVITGAGSGMGRTLALQLAQRGALVLLSDIHEVGLAETEHLVQQQGGRCKSYKMDVGDKPQVEAFAKAVLDEFKFIDVLINNAGMAIGKASFDEIPMDDFERLINVNLWGVIQHTKLFLPSMLTRPEAAIVNTSSVFGLFPVPSQVPYCVSKYAVRGFTETLRMELNGTNVAVTCVHPGGIKTNIVNYGIHYNDGEKVKAEFDKVAITSAEKAASIIIRAIEKKAKRVMVGPDAKLIRFVSQLSPNLLDSFVLKRQQQLNAKLK